jgi:hypothetical protein
VTCGKFRQCSGRRQKISISGKITIKLIRHLAISVTSMFGRHASGCPIEQY